MNKSEIDILIAENSTDNIIKNLTEIIKDEYSEYAMLKLAESYLLTDNRKDAKKILKKLQRLFPEGEFFSESEKIMQTIENAEIEIKQLMLQEKHKDSVAQVLKNNTTGKDIQIPQNMEKYFEDTVGMESVARELDKFYKILCLQNDRKKQKFEQDLLKSTHFAIVGERGSGKTLVGSIIGKLLCAFNIRTEEDALLIQARELLRAYDVDADSGVETLFSCLNDKTIIIENIQEIIMEREDVPIRQITLCMEKIMHEKKSSLSIIFTGNKKAFNDFFSSNENFKDALQGIIEIPAYSAEELLIMAEKLATERALCIHSSARKNLLHRIDLEYQNEDFMNAITLGRYLDEATERLAERYDLSTSSTEEEMVYLMPEDFGINIEEEDLEELLLKLESMVGLTSVKTQIRKMIEATIIENEAREAGSQRQAGYGSLHMLFTGNPGTGKTTVARLIGKMYQQLGILPRGNCVVECTRSDLVAKYVGHTAKLVKAKVKEAMGGVLFIDEAYALCRNESDSFGHEAVDELIAVMENNKDNIMIILAGYTDEMKEFLKSNPGFRSRIRNNIVFDDYSSEEMVKIFKEMIHKKKMQLNTNTDEILYQLIETKSKTPDFGNARGVRNLVEYVVEAANARIINLKKTGRIITKNQYDIICREDIQSVLDTKSASEKTLQDLMEELNRLIGLTSVKKRIQEIVNDIQVKKYMEEKGISNAAGRGTMHMVFKGNAGTGKTTVARLLGEIYKKLGILSKNVFVEVGRKDLVANYLGQTTTQVSKKIKEAEGGILFIDEAYTLLNGNQDEFGREAINTLVAEMENQRDNLIVIMAGYSDDMDKFLSINQGLTSRLSAEIVFEDYNLEELCLIFNSMVEKSGMCIAPGLEKYVKELIKQQKSVTKDFGNARGVRNIVDELEKKKNSRIAMLLMNGKNPTKEELQMLIREDFEKYFKEQLNF